MDDPRDMPSTPLRIGCAAGFSGDRTDAAGPVELFDDTVIGFDSQGNEVVRVSVNEPMHERPGKLNSI